MELFILPEIAKRKDSGVLPDNFKLSQAQVLLYADGTPAKVRLNEEAEIVAEAKLKEGVAKQAGDSILPEEIETIGRLRLPDDKEPDCAHISFVNYNGRWLMSFDFRYNKRLARKHLDAARQFYNSALHCLKKGLLSPLIDNLFSCVELLAKAELLLMPNYLKKRTSHVDIQFKYGRFVDIGNAKPDFKATLNKLSGLRIPARYLKTDFKVSADETKKYLSVAKAMLDYIDARLAKI